jgi:competence protein ComEA
MRKWALVSVWLLCSGLWAVDINHASEAELDGLRGLGPAFTRRLMAERSRGPFASWDDLMRRVSGMGRTTAQKLSDQGLTVNEKALNAEKNSDPLKP